MLAKNHIYLVNERHCARSTVTIYLCGIKFFGTTLKREWTVFKLVRPAPSHKLPPVLSREEVRAILGLVRKPITRMVLNLIYCCGLRLSEGARLKVEDIDGGRKLIWVRRGKGRKDRSIPLPERTLELLGSYWKQFLPKAISSRAATPAASTRPPCNQISRQPCGKAASRKTRPFTRSVTPTPPISWKPVRI